MSNEIAATTPTELASFLASFTNAAEENKEALGLVNQNKLFALFKLSKDSIPHILRPGEADPSPQDMNPEWYFIWLGTRQSRALWVPESLGPEIKELYKQGICRTKLGDPNLFAAEKVFGEWLVNPHILNPLVPNGSPEGERVPIPCLKCPYNTFGSEAKFDEGKGSSKGKACKESTTIIFTKVDDDETQVVEKTSLYGELDDRWGELIIGRFSRASNAKDIEGMVLAAHGRGAPLPVLVFRVGQKKEQKGQIKWAHLSASVAGLINPKIWPKIQERVAKAVEYFEKINGVGVTEVFDERTEDDTREVARDSELPELPKDANGDPIF